MNEMAKVLIGTGLLLVVIGVLSLALGKIPGIGRLPGDIFIKKENFTFYFPLTTSIVISIILTLIFTLWQRK